MAHSIISCVKIYLLSRRSSNALIIFYIAELNDSDPYLSGVDGAAACPNKGRDGPTAPQ
jgi:hypothetical protein